MAQTALTGTLPLPRNQWTLVSEINCQAKVLSGAVEFLVAGSSPVVSEKGLPCLIGSGPEPTDDVFAMFPGITGATGIYAISRDVDGALFVSRGAV